VKFTQVRPSALPMALAERISARPATQRIAIDGPPWAAPVQFAEEVADRLRSRGRPAAVIPADGFWHDASLRFEHGREDADALPGWLDHGALRREVLDPVAAGTYLPSLRDPATNRATGEDPRPAPFGTVLLICGALLLGFGLPFDLTIHLALSPAARARRVAAEESWMLSAFDRYDAEVGPLGLADVVVRLDDPRHPAVHGLD